MEIRINTKGFDNIDKELNKLIDKIIKKAQKAVDKAEIEGPKKIAKEINKINRKAIRYFYSSYNPMIYGRTHSLNKSWHITAHKSEVRIDFSSSGLFGHRVSGQYIYDWIFKQGYHGGAVSGKGHPSPGTPYYKTYESGYTEWGYPAVKSTPPFKLMNQMIDDSLNEFDNIMYTIFLKNFHL